MSNPFTAHGINHLSASQLTTFASDPSRWYAQKVLGYRSPSGAAMERGKAVENVVVQCLKGDSLDSSVAAGEAGYDRACRFGVLGDIAKERELIRPMAEQALPALAKYGQATWPTGGNQHKISIPIRFGPDHGQVIEILGYLDLVFDDVVIDIKSTSRAPSDMSFAHRVQAAIYSRTTNKPVRFLYVTPKKTLLLEDSDTAASQAAVRSIVQRMARFLSLSDDKEVLRDAVPVITDSWSWRGEEDARRQIYGI